MITVERLKPLDVERVKNIQLADDQIKFAGTADAFLMSGSDTIHLHVIKHNEDVVGFFKLDTAYAAGYDFCSERGLGLRSFAVDKNQQGKGIGTGSVKALFPYLKSNYAEYDSIYLTVNCKNTGAVSCYKKGGFVDTNEKYLGGEAGPQHIMKAQII